MRGWVIGLLGAVVTAVVVAALLIVAATSSDTTVLELDVGDCFMIALESDSADIDTVDVLDCNDPHDAEVVFVGTLNSGTDRPYPSEAEMFAEIDRACAVVGDDLIEEFGLLPIAPNETSWEQFQGRFLCVAIPFGGEPVTGSLVGSRRISDPAADNLPNRQGD
jgi:hypothetical protein